MCCDPQQEGNLGVGVDVDGVGVGAATDVVQNLQDGELEPQPYFFALPQASCVTLGKLLKVYGSPFKKKKKSPT